MSGERMQAGATPPRARAAWARWALALWAAGVAWALAGPAAAAWGVASAQDPEVRAGARIFLDQCRFCHSLRYVRYAELEALGVDEDTLRQAAGEAGLQAPVARLSDEASLQGMFGLVPPDLSLMAKAREGGAAYIEELLLGYEQGPGGQVRNRVFPGIAMPDVLGVAGADEAARRQAETQARQVAAFLAWAADPRAEERVRLGYYVEAYLLVLTVLLYLVKRRIWSRLES